tara:strand:- start:564 stop:758 length:195 start_codon:yes stop_codon:yes gene_type:complete
VLTIDTKKKKSNMDNTKFDIKHLLTFGGVIAVAIASSYLIRGYLDLLRIKALKKELKQYDDDNK